VSPRPFDYDTFQDDLLGRLQVRFAATFNDFAVSSLAIVLMDAECYGLDALGYYLDSRVAEVYLSTATTRGAVSRLCRQLGYPMRGASAATMELSVAVPDAQAAAVTIPAGFQIQGPAGRVFEVASPVTFLPGDTGGAVTRSLPTVEGTAQQETFVSAGTPSQAFRLRRIPEGMFVTSGSIEVRVNGALWAEGSGFGALQEYEVGYNDDPPSVRFGDGVVGLIPPSGATVSVRYRVCSGASGRTEQGLVTAPVTDLVVGLATVALTITSPNRSVGGDDPETLEEARRNAPTYRRTRDVVVTLSDYEQSATAFADPVAGRVAVAQASATRSAARDLALVNQLAAIRSAASAPVGPVDARVASLRSKLGSITSELGVLLVNLGYVANEADRVNTAATGVQAAARSVEGGASGLGATAASQSTAAGLVRAAVQGFTVVSSPTAEQIRQSTLDSILSKLDTIGAGAGSITSAGTSIGAQVATLLAQVATLRDVVATLGAFLTDGTVLYALEAARASVAAAVGTAAPATAAYADVAAIEAAVVSDFSGSYAAIDAACTEIYAHVDQILAADGQANLITVPILSKDSAGFYVPPSVTLLAALQGHLDARKGTTQTVSVVSGGAFLLPAVVALRVGVRSGYSAVLLQTAVEAAVNGILRGRRFGVPLYVSDVWRAAVSLMGVAFVNVTIDGHLSGSSTLTDRLDASGNLIPLSGEIITKGTVSVSVEAAP